VNDNQTSGNDRDDGKEGCDSDTERVEQYESTGKGCVICTDNEGSGSDWYQGEDGLWWTKMRTRTSSAGDDEGMEQVGWQRRTMWIVASLSYPRYLLQHPSVSLSRVSS